MSGPIGSLNGPPKGLADGLAGRPADRPAASAGDVALVAIVLPRPEAALAITTAWDAGEAVVVLDPGAEPAVRERLLDMVTPTHILDADGRRDLLGGVGTPAGTAAVVTTSGTTDAPKTVELTVAGVDAIGAGFAAALDASAADRWLACLPLHHVAGLAILARARVSGAPVVVHPAFAVDAVAASPMTEQTTLVSLVPTMLHRLLEAGAPVHAFRRIITGGAPIPPALRRRAEEAGATAVDAYGLSETWGGVMLDGVPVPGAEVALGMDDEVLVRGAMVMRGYRLHPEETAAAFTSDGWLRTGDIGARDEDGSVRIVDRRDELVISGGVNVSPRAVETALGSHPLVDDVAVGGRPDDEWGERVVAYVVPRDRRTPPTIDELRAFARDRLDAAQLPRELVVVDRIPRSEGGKIIRRSLPRPS